MKFMVIVKASKDSEAGQLPTAEMLNKMGKFNEELVNAGVMVTGEGLHPSSKGVRVHIKDNGQRNVVDGPFAETKELVGGFWIWQCKSKEEALEWAKRCPNPSPGTEGILEIRQIFSPEDFAPADPTGEIRAREDKLRERLEKQKQ